MRGFGLLSGLLIAALPSAAAESRSASFTNVSLETGSASAPASSNLPAPSPIVTRIARARATPAPRAAPAAAAPAPSSAAAPAPETPPERTPWLPLGAAAALVVAGAAFAARRRARRQSNEVLAVAAHELKSPLSALESYLALMEHEGKSGEAAGTRAWLEDVARMRTTAAHLRRTIGGILEMTRLDDAHIKLDVRAMDLADCARETADSFRALAADSRVKLKLRVASAPAWGDPTRVRQILDNLVANALRHAPEGGAVEIAAGADTSGRPWCTVADDGAGVPADRRERLFTRFSRLTPPLRGEPGTGLGLYIGRTLARAQDGELAYETDSARPGARFRLTLPRDGRA